MWLSSALVGRFKEQQTLYLSVTLAYKASSVSGGWSTLPLTSPCFAAFLLSVSGLLQVQQHTLSEFREKDPDYLSLDYTNTE